MEDTGDDDRIHQGQAEHSTFDGEDIYAEDGSIVDAQLVKVDGDQIKADTWYKLKNGEIVEVER